MKKGNGYIDWLEIPLGSNWEKIKITAEDIRKFMIKHSDMEETSPDNNLNHFVASMIDPYSLYDILHYLKSYDNN